MLFVYLYKFDNCSLLCYNCIQVDIKVTVLFFSYCRCVRYENIKCYLGLGP